MYDPKLQYGSNACAINRGNCSHLCIPISISERVCKCSVGYKNDPKNPRKCIGIVCVTYIKVFFFYLNKYCHYCLTFFFKGIEELILFSINWEIKGVSINSSVNNMENVLAPISHIAMASSVDFVAS